MNPLMRRRDFLKTATATAAAVPATRAFSFSGFLAPSSNPNAVTVDARSVTVNGKRTLILCGEMHYARSTREMWPALLDRSKALGLNTIATYVFWNVHEPARDVYDFSGNGDLAHFLALCHDRGLNVFLRVGPYCCAEWNYGGFPPYLRDEPGITIRTLNQPYMDRVEKFFTRLAQEINPSLASNGGAVTLLQVENEYSHVAKRYGAEGQEYLAWILALGRRVGFGAVPLTECEGGAPGALETGNGDTFAADKIARFREHAPNAPLIWSECYPGWYEIWGGNPHIAPDPRDFGFNILDFIAGGGSGVNYYMWHGGTNFARTSMYLQATTYDFHAPLDEYGRETFLGGYLARMHHALNTAAQAILYGEVTTTTLPNGIGQTRWASGPNTITLLINRTKSAITPAHGAPMPPKSARILAANGNLLFDTHTALTAERAAFKPTPWTPLTPSAGPFTWASWSEPMPDTRPTHTTADDPTEQLSLTHDATDYCWYSHTLTTPTTQPQTLTIPYGADFFYLFGDGKLIAQTATPLHENRGPITPEDPAHPRILANRHEKEIIGFHHEFSLPAGVTRIDLLCTALGMVKGDWQIASPMNFERKGIWEGVLLGGTALKGWEMRPFLTGEQNNIIAKPTQTPWQPLNTPTHLTWHRATFPLSDTALRSNADFRLDATGLGKGSLFLNGHGLGRHWLVLAQGPNPKPTQRYYHVPATWLQPQNELIVFEEQPNSPTAVHLETRIHNTA